MTIKNYVPNFFTMGNLFSGMVGVYFAANNVLEIAAYAVLAGIFFDFFDGFFARKLNAQSEIGLQLDSLADAVTSGAVPAIIMFQLLQDSLSWSEHSGWTTTQDFTASSIIPYLGFSIALASAYRLAKFNVDDRQTESFIGLPTPANALLIISLPLILLYQSQPLAESLIGNTYFLLGLSLLSCIMLNAELALFALKFKSWGLAENKVRYGFLLLSVILLFTLKFLAIPLIIFIYILISILDNRNAR